jgi:cold shock CspA family protein
MRGKVLLIKKGFGKIIFNKSESPVLTLPMEVEDGDIAEVEFENKNMDKFKKFVAYSKEEYYGSVIGDFRGGGIILVTYPKLLGTVVFKGDFKKNSRVKFKLKKTFKGMEAIDVEFTKEFYKCFLPSFGKIEKRVLIPKSGVIEEVVRSDKFIVEGEIKSVGSRGFGFIRSEVGDVFFFVSNFERIFNRPPNKNEKVIFKYKNTPKGKTAFYFYRQKPVLPKDKQYFILDGERLPVSLYEKVFKVSPEIGDLVYYVRENGKIKLRKNDKEIEKYIFIKDERGDFAKGKINFINEEKKFGFIKSNAGNVYFTFKQFESFYKRTPKRKEEVKFFYKKSERGGAVSRFLENEFEVSKKAFSNFVDISGNDYYYAYVDNNKVKEIFRYESSDLSLSIACYKNANDKLKKLQAIECILENEFESKNIKRETLIKEELEILDELVEEFINTNKELAFEFELKRQKIEFNPNRLKRFNFEGIEFLKYTKIEEAIDFEEEINFIEPVEIKEYQENEEVYLIEDGINLIFDYEEKEKRWEIFKRRDNE